MFKFLRKYNKWILAVGGTLLMIVFLVPQAIQSLSQRAAVGGAVWATVGPRDEEVSAFDRNTCMQELDILERLGRAGFRLGITDQPEHWYLLVREAEQAGLTGGRAADQLSPEVLGTLASIVGPSGTLDQTVSKSLAIGRMLDLYQRSGKLSDTRLRAEAKRLFHTVEGRAVVLEASSDDAPAEPSETEILAQYERFRNVAPGGTAANPDIDENDPALVDNVAGFGYRLPDRFKIEWLRVNRDDVRELIEASDELNNIALIKHWKRYQQAKAFPEVEPGADVPERVRADLLNELTTAKLDAVRKFISDTLLASLRRLPSPEGYYILPEDWASQRVEFTDLAKALQSEFPGMALPAFEAVGDRWLLVEDLDDLEGLENAGTDKYASRTTDAKTLVGALKEFGGDPTVLIQEGVAGPIMTDRIDNSLVIFRIIDTDPSRPPNGVSEVRDRVVEDLKRTAAFEVLLAAKDQIERTAKDDGLLTVAMQRGSPLQRLSVSLYSPSIAQFQLQNNLPLNPTPNSLPVIGQNDEVSEAIVDHALSLPGNVPLADTPRADRVMALPVPGKMALMVVELDGQTPLDRDRFNLLVGGNALQTMLVSRELIDADESLSDVFSYDVMKVRNNFNVNVREDDIVDETQAAADTDPDTDS